MNELAHPKITEINFIPVKPKDGLVGFVSFVYDRQFYFGNISVFTRINPGDQPTYRLSYPDDAFRKRSIFHPIKRDTQQSIEKEVSSFIDQLMAGAAGPMKKGDDHAQ